MWKHKIYFLSLVSTAALFACTHRTGADTPEKALQEYINIGFSAKSIEDKKHLLDLSTDEAYASLAKISDQDFLHQFVESKLNLLSFKTRDLRKEDNGDVSLIYEISFEDKASNVGAANTNKKVAFMSYDSKAGVWKIKSTTNVKSLVERKEDLLVTPESTKAPSKN